MIGGGSTTSEVKFGPENLHKRQFWKCFPSSEIQGAKSASLMNKDKSTSIMNKVKPAANEGIDRYRHDSGRVEDKKGAERQQGSRGFNATALSKNNDANYSPDLEGSGSAFLVKVNIEKGKENMQKNGSSSGKTPITQKVWVPIGLKPNHLSHNVVGRL